MKRVFTLLFVFITISSFSYSSPTLSTTVVISQVYGGGGATSGTPAYKYDYVELHNVSGAAVNISGYSLQYGSSTGNFASSATNLYVFPAGTTIPSGGYFLIKLGSVGTVGADFIADHTTTNLSMSSASGKVALVNNNVALGCGATATPCALPHANIIDLVAYGAANNGEGGTTAGNGAALDNTKGAVRKSAAGGNAGCTETDNNNTDFSIFVNPVPRTSTSTTFICPAAAPVPITLQNFSANKNGNNTDLHWLVNCRSTSVTFELQRSSDAANFQTFYRASETKARCAAPFDFTDVNALKGKNYYRLKIIDIDGKVSYSKIALIVHGVSDKGLLSIRPTIVHSQAEVYYTSANPEKVQWIVTDVQGRIAKKFTSSVLSGENKLVIPTSDLSTGQYQLKGFTSEGATEVIKFVKQ